MANARDLVVNFLGTTTGLEAAAGRAQSVMGSTEAFISRTLAKIAAAIAAAFAFDKIIEDGMRFETLETKFKVLLGSQERAVAMMKNLQEVAAQTPLPFEDIAAAAQFLMASGTSVSDLNDELKMLGDLAAVSGGDLRMVANAYTQVRSAQRLQGQEMLQFINQNIPLVELLADHLGVAEKQIRGMMREGRIGFADVQGALRAATSEGGRFDNAMKELAATSAGARTHLLSTFTISAAAVGRYILRLSMANDIMGIAAALLQGIADNAKIATPAIVSIGVAFLVYAHGAKAATFATKLLKIALGDLVLSLGGWIKLLGTAAIIFATLWLGEQMLASETDRMADAAGRAAKEMQDQAAAAAEVELGMSKAEAAIHDYGVAILPLIKRLRELDRSVEQGFLDKVVAEILKLREIRAVNIPDIMIVKPRAVDVLKEYLAELQKLNAVERGLLGERQVVDKIGELSGVTDMIREASFELDILRGGLDEWDKKLLMAERAGALPEHLSVYASVLDELRDINYEEQKRLAWQEESLAVLREMEAEQNKIIAIQERAAELAKTPAQKFEEQIAEFKNAGVDKETLLSAAAELASNTGAFRKQEKPIVSQSANTAVAGGEAISTVLQFQRDMERQAEEAKQQAKRDEEAQKLRLQLLKAAEKQGIDIGRLVDKIEVAEGVQ